jgi:hypothetical protein
MRYVKDRESFLKKYKLNEENQAGSGALGNEIKWGDSLVGRLINWAIRKGGIQVAATRMDKLIPQLRDQFQKIIDENSILALDEQERLRIFKTQISALLGALKQVVYKKEKVNVIKSVTDNTISEIESIKVDEESEKSKNEILQKLKEFRKFLDQFGDDEGEEDKPIGEDNIYEIGLKNFENLYHILFYYSEMKKSAPIPDKTDNKSAPNLNIEKETINKETESVEKNENYTINEQLKGVSPELLKAIRPVYNYYRQYFEFKEPKREIGNLSNQENKLPIIKVYKHIRKKSSIKENLKELLTRPEAMGDKINSLYQFTKSKPNGDFEGIDENLKQRISSFNSTMGQILSVKIEQKNEFLLSAYDRFVQLIKEAEGDDESGGDEGKPKDLKTGGVSDKIIEYFEKEFNFEAWVVDKTEIEKISKNAEKISEENKDGVTINGIDPIINIIKLFNRAYKLHTTNTIPGGRSDGAVSRKVYDEYDAFGGSEYSSEPNAIKNGPYRNRKIFNIWEDAVLGIMSERKFQPIFSKDTKIRVGDKMYPGKGVALRQFMTDMLDGEKLYKRGAQKQFLDKYFGDVEGVKELGEGDTSYKDKKGKLDSETNSEISGKIPTPSYKFFEYKDVKDKIDNKLRGRIIKLKSGDSTIYGFIQEIDDKSLLLVYSRSLLTFKNYIKVQEGGSPAIDEERFDRKNLYATKIERQFIFPGNNLKINSIKKEKSDTVKGETAIDFEVKETLFLSKSTEGKAGDIFLFDPGKLKLAIDNFGGFDNIKELVNREYEGGFKPITTKS